MLQLHMQQGLLFIGKRIIDTLQKKPLPFPVEANQQ